MTLDSLLSQRKAAILDRWRDIILESYPADSSRFFKNEKDPFTNPVGSALVNDLGKFFESFIADAKGEEAVSLLDYFIKMRSVQEFTPAEAVAFIFQLKIAVRDNLKEEIQQGAICEALLRFETKLDTVSLEVFNSYMKCKEQLFDLKTKQARAVNAKLLERVNQPRTKQPLANQALGTQNHNEDRKDGEK